VQSECEQLKQQADATTATSTTIATLQQGLSDTTALRVSESTNATAAYAKLQTQLTRLQSEFDTLQVRMHESEQQHYTALDSMTDDNKEWQDKALQYKTSAADTTQRLQDSMDKLQKVMSVCAAIEANNKVCTALILLMFTI
jgi:demethoxyubiquinone hydroxylase (CLK1/Coq7/Cat5 family)